MDADAKMQMHIWRQLYIISDADADALMET